MPIAPPYSWVESDSGVTITAACRGATSAGTSVFSSPCFVNVNSPPYFLELDLHANIVVDQSVTTVREGTIVLKLCKEQAGSWGRLLTDLPKSERLRRRARSRAEAEAQAQANDETKKRRVWERSRHTLGKQMEQETINRERLEQRIQEEKTLEANKLQEWQAKARTRDGRTRAAAAASPESIEKEQRIFEIEPELDPDEPPPLEEEAAARRRDESNASRPSASGRSDPSVVSQPVAELPPPRSTASITIKFTPKMLPSPARTKGNDADLNLPQDPLAAPGLMRGVVSADGDISQRDPAWLKARGDHFYHLRDWTSAENAYSLVLAQFDNKIIGQAIDTAVACYSNRAACRLQKKQYLSAATDAGDALGIMCKARCVTEYPKSEAQIGRGQIVLLARRGGAYAHAGLLRRASRDMSVALRVLGDSSEPSAVIDKQMLAADLQRVTDRQQCAQHVCDEADAILSPHLSLDVDAEPQSRELSSRAHDLYTEALALQPRELGALANRAVASLQLGDSLACVSDCDSGLKEIAAEERRDAADRIMATGQFALPAVPEEVEQAQQHTVRLDRMRFELLRRRAAAKIQLEQLPEAAADLKAALKLRPNESSVCFTLDDVSRRARAANIELEPQPVAIVLPSDEGSSLAYDLSAVEAAPGQVGANSTQAGDPADAAAPREISSGSSHPPVGTRSAVQLKSDADNAFKSGHIDRAVALYGKAMQADAAAEWLEGAAVGGLVFRCQCLANRAACYLKSRKLGLCVDDASAALAALGASPDDGHKPLRLKLLARRGMCLCQLERFAEAKTDYTLAVELDPGNDQLRSDLAMIDSANKTA